jgi:hypothetical protein
MNRRRFKMENMQMSKTVNRIFPAMHREVLLKYFQEPLDQNS